MAIEIRPLQQRAEFTQAVELQRIIWGFEDVDLLPERLFVIAPKVGGQAFGAMYDQRLADQLEGGGIFQHGVPQQRGQAGTDPHGRRKLATDHFRVHRGRRTRAA